MFAPTAVVFSLAVLLTSVAAQGDSRIPGYSAEVVQTYIAALPSGEACDAAFNTVLSPAGNLTEAEYSAALQTFCSVDCGGSVVELTVTNCRSLEFAAVCSSFSACQGRTDKIAAGVHSRIYWRMEMALSQTLHRVQTSTQTAQLGVLMPSWVQQTGLAAAIKIFTTTLTSSPNSR